MFTICLFMFWLHTVVLGKRRKLQYTNRVNLSVFTVHLAKTSLQPFTVFIKKLIVCLLKSGITRLIHNKDDIEFVTAFPCLLGQGLLVLNLLFFSQPTNPWVCTVYCVVWTLDTTVISLFLFVNFFNLLKDCLKKGKPRTILSKPPFKELKCPIHNSLHIL